VPPRPRGRHERRARRRSRAPTATSTSLLTPPPALPRRRRRAGGQQGPPGTAARVPPRPRGCCGRATYATTRRTGDPRWRMTSWDTSDLTTDGIGRRVVAGVGDAIGGRAPRFWDRPTRR
jgi:hypothetical protein